METVDEQLELFFLGLDIAVGADRQGLLLFFKDQVFLDGAWVEGRVAIFDFKRVLILTGQEIVRAATTEQTEGAEHKLGQTSHGQHIASLPRDEPREGPANG